MHPLIALHGSTVPLPEKTLLHAGELSMFYETGFIRYVKAGDKEIVRMINHYIRDATWANVPMTIVSEKIEKNETSFSVDYEALCQAGDIQFKWNCRIKGNADSSVTFEIKGEALQTFERNRLGFTVLHATDPYAGTACEIVHSDKRREIVRFPDLIEPFQPFFDITAMHWIPEKGIEAILEFTGEIFEAEDQRNWGDASYKTYCTPLVKPIPATVAQGDVISQGIYLKVNTTAPLADRGEKQLTLQTDRTVLAPFPAIGLTQNDLAPQTFTTQCIVDLAVDFLRIDIHSQDSTIREKILKVLAFNLPLDVALFIGENESLDFIDELIPFTPHIRQFIVLPGSPVSTDRALLDRVTPVLRVKFPKTRIGGGSDIFFTELNRKPTPPATLDYLSFPFTPQAHAGDMLTMTENLNALSDTIRSCRSLADGRDIHVGPVSFKTRWKFRQSKVEPTMTPYSLPGSVDPRQLSLYGAGWTIGCFKYLAESKAREIAFYETCGWRGLLSHPDQPWPTDFLFPAQSVYPVYLVLKEMLKHKSEKIVKLISSDPLTVDGVAFLDGQGKEIILMANYTEEDQSVTVAASGPFTQYWSLHEDNIDEALSTPGKDQWEMIGTRASITLRPFGIAALK